MYLFSERYQPLLFHCHNVLLVVVLNQVEHCSSQQRIEHENNEWNDVFQAQSVVELL